MSDHPRTDKFASELRGLGTGYYQALEEMKKIETDLTSAQKTIETQAAQIRSMQAVLKACDDFQHALCGSTMALAHGEPEKHVWDTINSMAPLMAATQRALHDKWNKPAGTPVPWPEVKEFIDAVSALEFRQPLIQEQSRFALALARLQRYAGPQSTETHEPN